MLMKRETYAFSQINSIKERIEMLIPVKPTDILIICGWSICYLHFKTAVVFWEKALIFS